MADIYIQYPELRGAVTNLRYVATQFEGSDETSEAAAVAVGHEALALQLREFAGNWDDTRTQFADACSGLADRIENLETACVKLDHGGR